VIAVCNRLVWVCNLRTNKRSAYLMFSLANQKVARIMVQTIIRQPVYEPPAMHFTNFCTTCGSPLTQKGWRLWIRGPICKECSRRGGNDRRIRSIVLIAVLVTAAFALGRSLRPAPPPLIIQRAANSPLSDSPINLNEITKPGTTGSNRSDASSTGAPDDTVYLCGARTKKGTPCKRRVHFAGERCYQHKGKPAMVPLEQLVIRP
jgi:hypothetical protein